MCSSDLLVPPGLQHPDLSTTPPNNHLKNGPFCVTALDQKEPESNKISFQAGKKLRFVVVPQMERSSER